MRLMYLSGLNEILQNGSADSKARATEFKALQMREVLSDCYAQLL
jgi:hypothetical protein